MGADHSFWLSEEGLKKADMFLVNGAKSFPCHSLILTERTVLGEQFVLDNPDGNKLDLTAVVLRGEALGFDVSVDEFLKRLYKGRYRDKAITELTASNLGLLFLWDYFEVRESIVDHGLYHNLNTTVVRALIANVKDAKELQEPPALLKRLLRDKDQFSKSLWLAQLRRVVCANLQQAMADMFAVVYIQGGQVTRHRLPQLPLLLTDDNKYVVTTRRYGFEECFAKE